MSQMPPVFFDVSQFIDGQVVRGRAIALASWKAKDAYACPYCARTVDQLIKVGFMPLLLDDITHMSCWVWHCNECELFIYSPRSDHHPWDGHSFASMEVIDFNKVGDFWDAEENN